MYYIRLSMVKRLPRAALLLGACCLLLAAALVFSYVTRPSSQVISGTGPTVTITAVDDHTGVCIFGHPKPPPVRHATPIVPCFVSAVIGGQTPRVGERFYARQFRVPTGGDSYQPAILLLPFPLKAY